MAQWEYLVRVFALDKDDEVVVDYVQRQYPDQSWKEMTLYDPLTLEAWLNRCGEEGWELMSLEAAESQGKKGEIGRVYAPGNNWARFYLCVFKRPARTGEDQ
ncbi:MAG TPA: hypothetical protein PKE20_05735 [Promineifilum sp.]|nr:hypothetical protein [Promineifilum sp.]